MTTQPDVLTMTTHSVPDHHVLLDFSSDDDAIEFTEWLNEIGWSIFLHHNSAVKP
jgi:hypothetical protein